MYIQRNRRLNSKLSKIKSSQGHKPNYKIL